MLLMLDIMLRKLSPFLLGFAGIEVKWEGRYPREKKIPSVSEEGKNVLVGQLEVPPRDKNCEA